MNKFLMIAVTAVAVFGFSYSLKAQTSEDQNLVPLGQVNLGFHGLEVSYELPVSKKMIWENSLGIGMGSNVYGSTIEYVFSFKQPIPFLKSELKYLYNLNKRANNGKNIKYNSANYVGLQTKYSFGHAKYYDVNKTLLAEVHWGLQRSLGGKFMFDTHVGLGYIKDFDTKYDVISPTFGVVFGYKLF